MNLAEIGASRRGFKEGEEWAVAKLCEQKPGGVDECGTLASAPSWQVVASSSSALRAPLAATGGVKQRSSVSETADAGVVASPKRQRIVVSGGAGDCARWDGAFWAAVVDAGQRACAGK